MTYHFSAIVPYPFEEAIAHVTEALKAEGLGILTEIDVQGAFKKKLDVQFRRYVILGACHPQTAYQMLQIDDKAGALYPCNVIVQEHEDGRVEVSAVNPVAMFAPLQSDKAEAIAMEVSQKIQSVIQKVSQCDPASTSGVA